MSQPLNVPVSQGDLLSADYLAAVIDHVAHPIFVKDRQFRFVLLNQAFCEMSGHPREAMLGKTDYDFYPKEQSDWFRAHDESMFQRGETVVIDEEPLTTGDGRLRRLQTTKVPLKGADGVTTHLVGIIHEITRSKEIEETLRHTNDELERRVLERTAALERARDGLVRSERLAVLGSLAGGLAHQIRNPLGAITNAAFVLRRLTRTTGSDEASRAIEIILEEASRANRIITDLLDHGRVKPPARTPTRVFGLIRQALSGIAVPKNVRVVSSRDDVPVLNIDGDQLRGALENLIQNAIEAMPDGGVLTVTTLTRGNEVTIGVEDTGMGIAPEVRERLFDPLVTTKSTGLGLGLVTARALVENRGGTLQCVAADRGRVRFEITIPIE